MEEEVVFYEKNYVESYKPFYLDVYYKNEKPIYFLKFWASIQHPSMSSIETLSIKKDNDFKFIDNFGNEKKFFENEEEDFELKKDLIFELKSFINFEKTFEKIANDIKEIEREDTEEFEIKNIYDKIYTIEKKVKEENKEVMITVYSFKEGNKRKYNPNYSNEVRLINYINQIEIISNFNIDVVKKEKFLNKIFNNKKNRLKEKLNLI